MIAIIFTVVCILPSEIFMNGIRFGCLRLNLAAVELTFGNYNTMLSVENLEDNMQYVPSLLQK